MTVSDALDYYPILLGLALLIAGYKYVQVKQARLLGLREEVNKTAANVSKAIHTRHELIKMDRLIANDYHLHELLLNVSSILGQNESGKVKVKADVYRAADTIPTKANEAYLKMQEDINRVEADLQAYCEKQNEAVSRYKNYRNSIPTCFLAPLLGFADDLEYHDPRSAVEIDSRLEAVDDRYRYLAEAIATQMPARRPPVERSATGKEFSERNEITGR